MKIEIHGRGLACPLRAEWELNPAAPRALWGAAMCHWSTERLIWSSGSRRPRLEGSWTETHLDPSKKKRTNKDLSSQQPLSSKHKWNCVFISRSVPVFLFNSRHTISNVWFFYGLRLQRSVTTGDRALIRRLVLGRSVITRSGAAVAWAIVAQQDGVGLSVEFQSWKFRGGSMHFSQHPHTNSWV